MLLAMPGVVAMRLDTAVAQVSGASVATTQVTDTVYRADGTAATGTVIVSWNAFTTPTGRAVSSGTTSATIAAGGVLSISLAPNAGATPMGSYYTAVYHLDDGTVSREFWVVPVSQSAVTLSAIRSTVLPTSVAMQTVSKSYVDTAIAAAVTGHPLDSSTPYVLKAGDTMTGPLVLPGDPTATTQAADKHYVDVNVAAATSGLGQKVSTVPTGTQTVTQPTGSQLQVNLLNGTEYASQYVNGTGNNGIANATSSPDCVNGCDVTADRSYLSGEKYQAPTWNSSTTGGTHVVDTRSGERRDMYLNPVNPVSGGNDAGQVIDVTSTRSAASVFQQTGAEEPASFGLVVSHEGLTGGSNQFPADVESSVPYFKSNYSALSVGGTYNTMGQHVLVPTNIACYGVGDCLMGSQFLKASGGFRDNADEGAHPFDLQIQEDTAVFQGTCTTGCTTGATVVGITPTSGPGTQGEGRFLIDKNPAKVLTAGTLTGSTTGAPGAGATFSGTAFPVSVFLSTAQIAASQANILSPGTVTLPILTGGVATGFATSTAALPASSGVACVVDVPNGFNPQNYEMANYQVVDGTHIQLTLNKVHASGATIAVGGLCGYGLEQTVDTSAGIRQVFPVIGSYSSTGLYYAAGLTPIVGTMGQTSAFANLSLQIAAIARSSNVVTVTTGGNLPDDVSGLTMTVAGVSDSSYNGSYTVTTTGPNTLTYTETGANSTSTGGSVAVLTGGYALYPMAEVLGVFNATTKSVDGQLTLAPNAVQWAANDVVEEPHYYQEAVGADVEYVSQTTPRPSVAVRAGIQYQTNLGPGMKGWSITNAAPVTNYFGHGGTHTPPDAAYEAQGVWLRTMTAQAGEQAVFGIHCNSRGCGRWNSNYNLFELDSNVGVDTMAFQPLTSAFSMTLRGTGYSFTPQAFTAGTINATTLNATTINAGTLTGTIAPAQLPVFGASGATHAAGAVPDPGATAGTTRYLREDGSWSTPTGSGTSGSSAASATVPSLTSGAIADYNFLQGSGTVLADNSGNGNNGTLGTGTGAPTWTNTGLSFALPQSVSLPAALNSSKTILMVVYLNPLAAAPPDNIYPLLLSSSMGGSGFNLLYTKTGNSSLFVSGSFAPSVFANNSVGTAANTLISGFHAIAISLGTAGTSVDHMYVDGVEYPYMSQTASAGLQSSGNFYLGASPAGLWSGSGFEGTYYRMRAYSTQLTSSQIAATSAAMVAEVESRGVAGGPVATMLATQQLHAVGDSITAGLGVSTAWPSLLSLTNQSSYTTTDWGIPGIYLEAISGSEANRVAPQCRSNSGPNVAIVFAGTNDLSAVAGATPTSVFGFAMGEVQTLKKAGCVVFLGTMISRTGNDNSGQKTMDADKDGYDGLILQQAKIAGADGVVDFAANPALGADGANTSATYFQADHVHPTQTGQQLLANAASNALNYYFGYNDMNPHAVTALPYSMTAADGTVSLAGVSGAGTLTLPDCTGQSGAVYRINNPQGAVAITIQPLNASEPINGLTSPVAVPANGSLVLRDVPNAKTISGCHWEM
jgi:lysophospholipase L1-like esterase